MDRRPIVVVADDLSGAAELAGIAFARGFSAEVQRQRFEPASAAEVIAVDTDSRGLPAEAAADRVREAARALLATKPAWMYKKVDSVLRGNVRPEIESLVSVTGHGRAVLAPANPSRGRTIEGGRLLIRGLPLEETEFAFDPEHPRRSSRVAELLGMDDTSVSDFQLPDVPSLDALSALAAEVDDRTLPAGAADFFAALLDARAARHSATAAAPADLRLELPALFVCGSKASWGSRAAECAVVGVSLRTFPPAFEGERLPEAGLAACADIAASRLATAGRLLLGIGPVESTAAPADLVNRLADLTALVLERTPVASLLLEGGATAAAVAARLGWARLAVSARAPAGIGILRPLNVAAAPQVWIKPGSYPWPDAIWRRDSSGGLREPQ
jgi:uncharacterized protein YgbK (DUF1537 family)